MRLAYAELQPALVIDIVTLTGACVVAFGERHRPFRVRRGPRGPVAGSGINTEIALGAYHCFEEYQDMFESNFADMSNLGGRPAGAITAACFLERFVNNYKWAHLDIAGTNALTGDNKGATGQPVPLLTEFLIARAENRASQTTGARAA